MEKSLEFAKYILMISKEKLDVFKLEEKVYFINLIYSYLNNGKTIIDEDFEVTYGGIRLPSVYNKYIKYGENILDTHNVFKPNHIKYDDISNINKAINKFDEYFNNFYKNLYSDAYWDLRFFCRREEGIWKDLIDIKEYNKIKKSDIYEESKLFEVFNMTLCGLKYKNNINSINIKEKYNFEINNCDDLKIDIQDLGSIKIKSYNENYILIFEFKYENIDNVITNVVKEDNNFNKIIMFINEIYKKQRSISDC